MIQISSFAPCQKKLSLSNMGITAILSRLKPSEEGKVLTSHEKAYQKWKKLPKAGDFVKPVSRKESEW